MACQGAKTAGGCRIVGCPGDAGAHGGCDLQAAKIKDQWL